MANRVMGSLALALTLSLVLLDSPSANAGVDLPDKAGAALVAMPNEYVFKSEIATKAFVLPIGNLDFLKSLPVHDPEISEPKEDQNSKLDDENEAWVEVETESVVGAVQPSVSDSGPFTVIHLGHRHHNCRHKPWFRELPHNENEYGNDESFNKDNGEDVSFDSMILGVMHLEQAHGLENWKKHSSMPYRRGVGVVHGVRGFKRLDHQESEEEKMESTHKEDEKSGNETKEEQSEKEVEKTEAEPKDVKTENEAKEEKTENQQKEEETESKETEQKTETKAKEELEKETTEKQVRTWLNRFLKFMNF